MVITPLGLNALKFEIKRKDGTEVAVVLDPFEPFGKLKLPRVLKAHMVVSTTLAEASRMRELVAAEGEAALLVVNGPGEYERSSCFVTGREFSSIAQEEKKAVGTLFRLDGDDVAIGILTALAHDLTEEEKEFLDGVQILVLNVSGEPLPLRTAVGIVQTLEPSAVIPIGYRTSEYPKGESLSAFTKLLGVEPTSMGEKWKITRSDLDAQEGMIVVGFGDTA